VRPVQLFTLASDLLSRLDFGRLQSLALLFLHDVLHLFVFFLVRLERVISIFLRRFRSNCNCEVGADADLLDQLAAQQVEWEGRLPRTTVAHAQLALPVLAPKPNPAFFVEGSPDLTADIARDHFAGDRCDRLGRVECSERRSAPEVHQAFGVDGQGVRRTGYLLDVGDAAQEQRDVGRAVLVLDAQLPFGVLA